MLVNFVPAEGSNSHRCPKQVNVLVRPSDGGGKFVRNITNHLLKYTIGAAQVVSEITILRRI